MCDYLSSCVIKICCWEHWCGQFSDGTFEILHRVTPLDGGYGTPVREKLPADYFAHHSVEDLYWTIAPQLVKPAKVDKAYQQFEIETITEQFRQCGWIS